MRNLILIFLAWSSMTYAQDETSCYFTDPNGRIREHNVDFEKLILEVSFIPENGQVNGRAVLDFTTLQPDVDTIWFDGPGIVVNSLQLDGQSIEFQYGEKGFTALTNEALLWNSEHQIIIDYTANPERGIYFIGWNDPTNRSYKQIWTQGQGIDNRHWIPCFDQQNDKLVTETIVHFDSDYEVLSNGNLKSTTQNEDGTTTWHYAMDEDHTTYLIMLGIGDYDYRDQISASGVRTRQYYYPDRAHEFEPMYQYSVEMMDWMEAELEVPYPWETYANIPVQDFLYGAMENTTATIFTDYYHQDERGALERNYVGTNAHELAHQWFGDYVTAWSGTHHWLQESFATHYAKHFRWSVYGDDWYQWERRNETNSAIGANAKNQKPIAHSEAGSSRHYPQGSFVLDMMRYVLGNEAYRAGVTRYLNDHPYTNVDSHDFYKAFLEELGINLDWFFDQWVYKGGIPHYEVSYTEKEDVVEVIVVQNHTLTETVGYFKMPIVFQAYDKYGKIEEVKAWVEGPRDTIDIPIGVLSNVEFVLFDPNSEILKTCDFDKTYDEIISQANLAENMIDRYDALLALREFDIEEKRADLIEIYEKETFHATKSEIIDQLIEDDHKKTIKLMKDALMDDDHRVRRTCIDEVNTIPESLVGYYERLLKDESYITTSKALRKLCEEFPEKKAEYLEATKDEIGMNKVVRITWLELAVEDHPDAFLDELVDYTSISFEFRTRSSAFQALARKMICNEAIVSNGLEACVSINGRLANPAAKALRDLMEVPAYEEMILSAVHDGDWDEEALETIKNKLKLPE